MGTRKACRRVAVVLALAAVMAGAQGCGYLGDRLSDSTQMFDLGLSFSAKPQFSAYVACPVIPPLGYGTVDGYYVGMGSGKVGAMKLHEQGGDLLVWGREDASWESFDAKKADTLSVQGAGVLGLAEEQQGDKAYNSACIHYLHLGFIGVAFNIRWLEIPDFFTGFALLDPMGDDAHGGWWFGKDRTPVTFSGLLLGRSASNQWQAKARRRRRPPHSRERSNEPMAKRFLTIALCVAIAATAALAAESGQAERRTVEDAYPGLSAGVLSSASIGNLPDGVLVDLGDQQITQKQIDEILAKAPDKLKDQLSKNSLFMAQDLATPRLLIRAAREWATAEKVDIPGKSDPDIISDYLQSVAAGVTVSDTEVGDFYQDNTEMFNGAKLEDVKEALTQYLRKQKRQEKVDRYIASLGGKCGVVVSATWLKAQVPLAMDNPVDKARTSGKPTMVDFGSTGCTPCEMMAPILKTLETKYAGKANVLFVQVGEEQVLAARYGVQTIPLQVFFDRDGKEVSRHVGFFPQDKIEARLSQLGVR